MDKLERLLMPIVLVIGILGLLMAQAGEGTVIVVARTVGILLAVLLASGFVIRWVLKFRGARRELDELRAEYELLLAEQASIAPDDKEPNGDA